MAGKDAGTHYVVEMVATQHKSMVEFRDVLKEIVGMNNKEIGIKVSLDADALNNVSKDVQDAVAKGARGRKGKGGGSGLGDGGGSGGSGLSASTVRAINNFAESMPKFAAAVDKMAKAPEHKEENNTSTSKLSADIRVLDTTLKTLKGSVDNLISAVTNGGGDFGGGQAPLGGPVSGQRPAQHSGPDPRLAKIEQRLAVAERVQKMSMVSNQQDITDLSKVLYSLRPSKDMGYKQIASLVEDIVKSRSNFGASEHDSYEIDGDDAINGLLGRAKDGLKPIINELRTTLAQAKSATTSAAGAGTVSGTAAGAVFARGGPVKVNLNMRPIEDAFKRIADNFATTLATAFNGIPEKVAQALGGVMDASNRTPLSPEAELIASTLAEKNPEQARMYREGMQTRRRQKQETERIAQEARVTQREQQSAMRDERNYNRLFSRDEDRAFLGRYARKGLIPVRKGVAGLHDQHDLINELRVAGQSVFNKAGINPNREEMQTFMSRPGRVHLDEHDIEGIQQGLGRYSWADADSLSAIRLGLNNASTLVRKRKRMEAERSAQFRVEQAGMYGNASTFGIEDYQDKLKRHNELKERLDASRAAEVAKKVDPLQQEAERMRRRMKAFSEVPAPSAQSIQAQYAGNAEGLRKYAEDYARRQAENDKYAAELPALSKEIENETRLAINRFKRKHRSTRKELKELNKELGDRQEGAKEFLKYRAHRRQFMDTPELRAVNAEIQNEIAPLIKLVSSGPGAVPPSLMHQTYGPRGALPSYDPEEEKTRGVSITKALAVRANMHRTIEDIQNAVNPKAVRTPEMQEHDTLIAQLERELAAAPKGRERTKVGKKLSAALDKRAEMEKEAAEAAQKDPLMDQYVLLGQKQAERLYKRFKTARAVAKQIEAAMASNELGEIPANLQGRYNDLRSDPLLHGLMAKKPGRGNITHTINELDAAAKELQPYLSAYRMVGGKTGSLAAPKMRLNGETSVISPVMAAMEDDPKVKEMMLASLKRAGKKGWKFTGFDDERMAAIQLAMAAIEEELPKARKRDRGHLTNRLGRLQDSWMVGGEWTRGPHKGFRTDEFIAPFMVSKVAAGAAGEGNKTGAPSPFEDVKKLQEVIGQLQNMSVNKLVAEFKAMATFTKTVHSNLSASAKLLNNTPAMQSAVRVTEAKQMRDIWAGGRADRLRDLKEHEEAQHERRSKEEETRAANRARLVEEKAILKQNEIELRARLNARRGNVRAGFPTGNIDDVLRGYGQSSGLSQKQAVKDLGQVFKAIESSGRNIHNLSNQIGVARANGADDTPFARKRYNEAIRLTGNYRSMVDKVENATNVFAGTGHFSGMENDIGAFRASQQRVDALSAQINGYKAHLKRAADSTLSKNERHAASQAAGAIRDDLKNQGFSNMYDAVKTRREWQDAENMLGAAIGQRAQKEHAALSVTTKSIEGIDKFIGKMKSLSMYMGANFLLYSGLRKISQAFGAAGDAEYQSAQVRGIIPFGDKSDQLLAQRESVKIARDYGTALKDVLQTTKLYVQAGENLNNSLALTRATLVGVRGAGMETKEAMDVIVATRHIMNGAVGPSELIDRISHVESRHAVTSMDLAKAIQLAGPLTKQLQPGLDGGVDALDLVAGMSTAIIEKTRVSGNQAATSLRMMMARMAQPRVQRAMQERFGIDLAGSNPNEMRPLAHIFGDIAKTYQGLTKKGQTIKAEELLVTVAGGRQVNAAAALFTDWDKAMTVAKDSSIAFGDAQRRLALQMDTLSAKSDQLSSAWTGFTTTFIRESGLLDVSKAVVGGAGRALSGATNYMDEHRGGALFPAAAAATGAFALSRYAKGLRAAAGTFTGESGIGRLLSGLLGRGAGVAGAEVAAGAVAAEGGAAAGGLSLFARVVAAMAGGPFMSAIATLLAVVTVIAGAKAFMDWKSEDDPTKRGYAVIDPKQLQESDVYKRFADVATRSGVTIPGFKSALLTADMEARKSVLSQFPGTNESDIFTSDDKGRKVNRGMAEAYTKVFNDKLEMLVPGFKKVKEESEGAASALGSLKDLRLLTTTVIGQRQSESQANMSEASKKLAEQVKNLQDYKPITYSGGLPASRLQNAEFGFSQTEVEYLKRDKGKISEVIADILKEGFGGGEYGSFVANMPLFNSAEMAPGAHMKANLTNVSKRAAGLMVSDPQMKTLAEALDFIAEMDMSYRPGEQELIAKTSKIVENIVKEKSYDQATKNDLFYDTLTNHGRDSQGLHAYSVYYNQTEMDRRGLATIRKQYGISPDVVAADQATIDGDMATGGAGAKFANMLFEQMKRLGVAVLKDPKLAQTQAATQISTTLDFLGDPNASNKMKSAIAGGKASGAMVARDRVLELVLGLANSGDEISGMEKVAPQIGMSYNALQERRTAAQTALRGVMGIRGQMRSDWLRALTKARYAGQLELSMNPESAIDESLSAGDEGGIQGPQAGLRILANAIHGTGAADLNSKAEKQASLLQEAFDGLKNGNLLSSLPDDVVKNLQTSLDSLGKASKVGDKLPLLASSLAQMQNVIVKLNTVLEAQYQARIKEGFVIQQQAAMRAYELKQQMDNAEFNEKVGMARADISEKLGAPGQVGSAQIAQLLRRMADESEVIRQNSDAQLKTLENEFADDAGKASNQTYLGRRNKIIQDRDLGLAERGATTNRAIADIMISKQLDYESTRTAEIVDSIRTATQPMKDVLKESLINPKSFKGSEAFPRILGGFADTISTKMSTKLVDLLAGEHGIFGKAMADLFGNDALIQQETVRKGTEAGVLAALVKFNGGSVSGLSGGALPQTLAYKLMPGMASAAAVAGAKMVAGKIVQTKMGGSVLAADGKTRLAPLSLSGPGEMELSGTALSSLPSAVSGAQVVVDEKATAEQIAAANKQMKHQAATQLAIVAAQMGGAMLGQKMGKNKGNNYAAEGAALGTIIGTIIPGVGNVVGAMVGSAIGGIVGGLVGKKNPKETPEYGVMERIERNTRETITAIENSTRKLYDFETRMLNVPASFVVPGYRPMDATAGGGKAPVTNHNTMTFHIYDAADPQKVATAVKKVLHDEFRSQGAFLDHREN